MTKCKTSLRQYGRDISVIFHAEDIDSKTASEWEVNMERMLSIVDKLRVLFDKGDNQ